MSDQTPPSRQPSSSPRRPRPSSRRPAPLRKNGRTSRVLIWLLVAVAAAAVVVGLRSLRRSSSSLDTELGALPESTQEAPPPAGDRTVLMVFPEWDGTGYVTEQRRIPSEGYAESDLLGLMRELCKGPTISGAISALPSQTQPLSVFIDAKAHSAVLDFSAELVTRHPGGSAAELATITSILRTVALNFPDLVTCRVLVDGAQVETLSGHLVMDGPFDLRRWQ